MAPCAWCGSMFETWSGTSATRYCGPDCRRFRRLERPLPNQLSVPEAAYIAGLLDGEGSICPRKGRGVEVIVVGTYLPMLEWLLATTGTGTISKPLTRTGALGSKDCRHWTTGSVPAVELLRQLVPYMIEKRQRAVDAIDAFGPYKLPSGSLVSIGGKAGTGAVL